MKIITITIEGRSAKVRSPFEAKNIIKAMPVRRWSAPEKSWVVPANDVPVLENRLRAAGYQVETTRPGQSQPSQNNEAGGTWADQLLGALNPDVATAAYKALARVLHPDVGGSTEVMKVLNAARDRTSQR